MLDSQLDPPSSPLRLSSAQGGPLSSSPNPTSEPNHPDDTKTTFKSLLEAFLGAGVEEDDDSDDGTYEPLSSFFLSSTPDNTRRSRAGANAPMSTEAMIRFLDFLDEENVTLPRFLATLFSKADDGTDVAARMGKIHSTNLPEKLVKHWKGADEWAVQRVSELLAQEASRAVKLPKLQGNARKCTNRGMQSFDIAKLLGEVVRELPVSMTVLRAFAGVSERAEADSSEEESEWEDVEGDVLEVGEDGKEQAAADGAAETIEVEDTNMADGTKGSERKKKRRAPRFGWNPEVVVMVSILNILFARNKRCNRLALVFGLVLYASRVPRRSVELLSRAGVCVSYITILRAVDRLSYNAREQLRAMVRNPSLLWGLVYDNVNWMEKKQEQRMGNHDEMRAAVAGNVIIMDAELDAPGPDIPKCSDELFQYIHKQESRGYPSLGNLESRLIQKGNV